MNVGFQYYYNVTRPDGAPEAFQTGCPELSPTGERLLITRVPSTGSSQILLAGADGRDGQVLTNGTEPIWLPSGEEVLNVISQQTAVPQGSEPVENKVIRVEGADVRQVEGSFEAVAQGIRPGDSIRAVNGTSLRQYDDIRKAEDGKPGQALPFTIRRADGSTFQTVITPQFDKPSQRYLIGVQTAQTVTPLQAVGTGVTFPFVSTVAIGSSGPGPLPLSGTRPRRRSSSGSGLAASAAQASSASAISAADR